VYGNRAMCRGVYSATTGGRGDEEARDAHRPGSCVRRPARAAATGEDATMMTMSGGGFRPDSALYRPPAHLLRGGLARFATGVAVVTFDAVDGGELRRQGITVNS